MFVVFEISISPTFKIEYIKVTVCFQIDINATNVTLHIQIVYMIGMLNNVYKNVSLHKRRATIINSSNRLRELLQYFYNNSKKKELL